MKRLIRCGLLILSGVTFIAIIFTALQLNSPLIAVAGAIMSGLFALAAGLISD